MLPGCCISPHFCRALCWTTACLCGDRTLALCIGLGLEISSPCACRPLEMGWVSQGNRQPCSHDLWGVSGALQRHELQLTLWCCRGQ
jgi:hypothetical protein